METKGRRREKGEKKREKREERKIKKRKESGNIRGNGKKARPRL